jgi:hypothetical protein
MRTPTTIPKASRPLGVCLAACVALTGCASWFAPPAATLRRERIYPVGLPRAGVLDVQVVREGTTIRSTNTSPRAFGPSILWLNQRYALPIARWEPGQTLTMNLGDFRDEFGDAFRAGGFFASEPPEPVVLAEVQTKGAPAREPGSEESFPEEMVGLVAVREGF